MKKTRIVKRTYIDGRVVWVIQQKHLLFRWWWVDACINTINVNCKDCFSSLEGAKKNLYYFDGSKPKNKIVYISQNDG